MTALPSASPVPAADPADAALPAPAAVPELPRRDLVAALEKGLQVIECFDQDRPRLSISEVAQRTGLTRAAARRYLLTLAHLGYVQQDRRLFSLSAKILRLGQSYMNSARLPRIIQPQLLRLAHGLKEASSAGVLEGSDVLCVAATSLGRVVSPTLQPGTRVPAYCSANGRVLLAALPDDAFEAWLAHEPLHALTPHTLTSPDELRAAVRQAARQGYALVDQELELGLRTIAVPLRNHRGETVAAINVSVNAARLTPQDLLERCLPALFQVQAQLRSLL